MTIGMKDRSSKNKVIQNCGQKPIFPIALIKLADNIIKNANTHTFWNIHKQLLWQAQIIILFLSSRCHIHKAQNMFIATNQSHKPCICKKNCAGFCAPFICSNKQVITPIKHSSWNVHARLKVLFLILRIQIRRFLW